jgi:hypothetical protein
MDSGQSGDPAMLKAVKAATGEAMGAPSRTGPMDEIDMTQPVETRY